MNSHINRRLVLAARPAGVPGAEHFRRDDQPVQEPGEGQFLVRNMFLSVDPAQRGWVNADSNYSDPVPIGAVMRSLAVGVVESSRHPAFSQGESLYGWFGWQDFCVATDKEVLRRVDPNQASVTAALGVLGITGLTAYLALTDVGRPKEDETIVVSTAAGAVGSIVGQLARRLGCRVVGLVGSDAKAVLCKAKFGYHEAINYNAADHNSALQAACPDGVDIYFDNTSGSLADAVVPLMNIRGRIIQCGTAAVPVWSPPPAAPRRDREILVKRLRHEGFIIFDHIEKFPAVSDTLATWVKEGALVYREDIEQGLDQAPNALAGLYRGENRGKKIIRLEPEPGPGGTE